MHLLRALRLPAAAACGTCLALAAAPPARAQEPPAPTASAPAPRPELRGVWLTAADDEVLSSRRRIAEAMDFLAGTGVNVVFPVVWSDGYTRYASEAMRRRFGAPVDPRVRALRGRDPLAELVFEAHRAGLEVVPWFEGGFAASAGRRGGHILQRLPRWAARDRLGQPLTSGGVEWMNAFDPEVQALLIELVMEVVRGYDVDGIQAGARLPALPPEGGYDSLTVDRYRREFGHPPPDDAADPRWVAWRANLLSAFLGRLRDSVKAADAALVVSLAPAGAGLQDVREWARRGLYDALHPVAAADSVLPRLSLEPGAAVFPSVLVKHGAYRISRDSLLAAVRQNRERGLAGEVLLHYAGLRDDGDELARALRAGPYAASPAPLPYRGGRTRRPAAPSLPRAPAGDIGALTRAYTLAVPQAGEYVVHARNAGGGELSASVLVRRGSGDTRLSCRSRRVDPLRARAAEWQPLLHITLSPEAAADASSVVFLHLTRADGPHPDVIALSVRRQTLPLREKEYGACKPVG